MSENTAQQKHKKTRNIIFIQKETWWDSGHHINQAMPHSIKCKVLPSDWYTLVNPTWWMSNHATHVLSLIRLPYIRQLLLSFLSVLKLIASIENISNDRHTVSVRPLYPINYVFLFRAQHFLRFRRDGRCLDI